MTDDERTPEDLRYRELFERSRQDETLERYHADGPGVCTCVMCDPLGATRRILDRQRDEGEQPIEPFPLPAEGAFKIVEELHAAEESE